MPDIQNINEEKEENIEPKGAVPEIAPERVEPAESQELPAEKEANEQKELRQKIETAGLDDGLKQQATQTAQTLTGATQEEKIKKLMLIVEQKGIIYAVNVAKKMDDPYVLDMFHDALAEQGLYKKFKE